LEQFAHACSLAEATVRNMQQNTVLAVSTVVLLLAGVLSGQIFLASGMLVHELSVLLVTFNAVRLIRYRPGKKVGPHAADVSLAPQFTGDSA
jgi:Cd2+/Zn2+-exporting ATPase